MSLNFDKLESSPGKKFTKYEIAIELSNFCKEKGNPIVFKDFGVEDTVELIKNIKINSDLIKDLSEDDKEYIRVGLEAFKNFVSGPIFTDRFHKESSLREDWKNIYMKELNKLNKKFLEYYDSNRLHVNKNTNAVAFLEGIEELINDPDIKNKLNALNKTIPCEFIDRSINEDGIKTINYYNLNDEEKIEVVNKLTKIVNEAIELLKV